MGAWIEIAIATSDTIDKRVAPFVGAWIEILCTCYTKLKQPSLPLWERGLKYPSHHCSHVHDIVAPFVGAWIEIVV